MYVCIGSLTLVNRMAKFDVLNATASELLFDLQSQHLTSRTIVETYLEQIRKTNDRLRAVLQIAPNALDKATERDRERHEGNLRGPLHGLPILIKAS